MVIYERRASRWIHAVCLVLTAGLTGVLATVFLPDVPTDPFDRPENITWQLKAVFGFFVVAGLFLTGVFTYRLIVNPAYFVITQDGFEYSPGGISTGLIKWEDILELREESVLTNRGGIGGPALETALAVVLRDPDAYVARYPLVLQPLFAVRRGLNSTPLLMRPSDFGTDYSVIKSVIEEQVRQQAARNQGRHASVR